jgi:chemotaxis protein histidine kinase CheA
VQAVGGDVEITSRIGDGTTVLVWVPRTAQT